MGIIDVTFTKINIKTKKIELAYGSLLMNMEADILYKDVKEELRTSLGKEFRLVEIIKFSYCGKVLNWSDYE